MQLLGYEYYVKLLNEQRLKQLAFNEQINIELLNLTEPESDKHHRQEYLKYLAYRILQIDFLVDQWLNSVSLDTNLIVE